VNGNGQLDVNPTSRLPAVWQVTDISKTVGHYNAPCNQALLLCDLERHDPVFKRLVKLRVMC